MSPGSTGRGTSRHPGDVARVVVGVAVLLLASLAVQRERLSGFEADVFRLVNNLPSAFEPVLVAVMQAGNFAAAPVLAVVIVALNRKRLRVAVDVSVAGPVAWFAARAIKGVFERPRPTGFFDDVLRFGDSGGLGFVSGHTAVAAAIATAAAPYLPRPWRRAIWLLPWTVGFARIYVGAHLPLDIVGGGALGWVVGASAHLLLGAPHRVPDLDEAARVMRRGAHGLVDLEPAAVDARGSFPLTAYTTEGRVFVKLLDPEPRDHDWIYRAARFLAFRDVRDEAAIVDGPARAYREAAMTLLARSSGARVPTVRGIERDADRVWIIQEYVPGRDLTRVDPSEVDDDVLKDLWTQLQLMRAARLAHRDLVPSNVILDDGGQPWVVDLAHAVSSASTSALDNDAAELLVTTAFLVGPERAVAAAVDILGPDGVVGALTELQPLALTPEARRLLAGDPTRLRALRHGLERAMGLEPAAADEPDDPRPLGAVGVGTLAALVGAALVALAAPGAVAQASAETSMRWIGVAVVATGVAVVAAAGAIVAAIGRRLAIGRTALVQLHALASSVLVGPGAGSRVMVRYLSRAGVPRGEVLGGIARVRRRRWLMGALALAVGILAAWEEGVRLRPPPKLAALAAVATVATAVQWLLTDRRGPVPADPARRRERRLDAPMLLMGAGIATGAELASTVAVVSAFGPGPAVGAVVVVAVVASMVDVLRPSWDAVGLGPPLMVAGLATAGMALPAAVGSTLVVKLLSTWIPVATGRVLVRRLGTAVGR